MDIRSEAFGYGETIPSCHTCDGEDSVPPLRISGVPQGAVSLALVVDDPDSPSGNWLHWSVWNLPPDTSSLGGRLAEGARQGLTSFQTVGWGGPCPGSGEHRYFFRLYALDAEIPLPVGADRNDLETALRGHVLEEAEWMGRYRRG